MVGRCPKKFSEKLERGEITASSYLTGTTLIQMQRFCRDIDFHAFIEMTVKELFQG